MKVTTEPIERSQVVMEVEVDQPLVDESMEKAFRRLAKRVNVPGFRRGKAPRHMVERMLGREAIMEDALEDLIPNVYNQALESEAIDAVAQPRIEVTQYDPVTFRATIAVRPTVTLGDYLAIRDTLQSSEADEAEVQKAIDDLRERQASWEPVDRPVQMDDLVTMDIEGSIGSEPFPRQEDVQYYCIAKSSVPVPGFPEMLEGTPRDTRREFTIDLPEDYDRVEVAGQTSRWSLTVKEIKQKALPLLDDDLAASLEEGFTTVDELRDGIRSVVTRNNRARTLDELENRIVAALVDSADLELPPALVEHETEHVMKEQEEELKRSRLDLQTYLAYRNQTVEELAAELQPVAERRLRQSYVINEFAKAEGIEATDEAIDADIARRLIGDGGEQAAGLMDFFNLPDIRAQLARQVFVRLVIDRLVEIATEGSVEPASIRGAVEAEERAEAETRKLARVESGDSAESEEDDSASG